MRSIAGFNGSSVNGSFAAGESISASALNKLATGIDATRTMPSNDLLYQSNTNGTAYALPKQVYYAGTLNPLDPSINDDEVTIAPGTVNRYIPKIGNKYIDESPPPTIKVTDDGYIMVKCTYEIDKFFPRTAEIVFQAVPTPPPDTDIESYYALGKITKTGDSYSLSGVGFFSNSNLVVNRLKSGANMATWWWTRV